MPNSCNAVVPSEIDELFATLPRRNVLLRLVPEHPQANPAEERMLARKRTLYHLALTLADRHPGALLAVTETYPDDEILQKIVKQFLFD